MSARDELAELLQDNITDSLPINPWRGELREQVGLAVQHVIAAGYSKPRTIWTHQERAALRPGTICMDLAGNAWKRGIGSWVGTGDGGPLYDEENLMMVVLYEAEAQQ